MGKTQLVMDLWRHLLSRRRYPQISFIAKIRRAAQITVIHLSPQLMPSL